MKKPKDITGKRFGRLTAICEAGKKKYPCGASLTLWKCICDCGNAIIIPISALTTGNTQSCGCLRKEEIGALRRTHGDSHKRLNEVWKGMRQRCQNKKHISYKYYGAKGVTVCDEWDKSYTAFRDWSLSHGYKPCAPRNECTLDRIDPCGTYSPENCRWITIVEQQKNKRKRA